MCLGNIVFFFSSTLQGNNETVKVGVCTTSKETDTYYFYFADKVRELRLKLFGHVQGRDRLLNMKLPGRGQRGRPQRRFMEVMMEDVQRVGVADEDA